ncbi:MAG: bile acid:sodium symporter family protein [Bacillota bacterium]
MNSLQDALRSANSLMQKYFVPIIVGCFALGGMFPDVLGSFKPWVPWLFAAMTLTGALRVSLKEIKHALLSPFQIVTALAVLHVIFPALVFLIGKAGLANDPDLYAGLALLSAVPTAVSGIMWVTLMKGNVALGVTLVTLDSILSPLVVPATVMIVAGAAVSFDAGSLMVSLLWMVVVPTIIGVTLHEATDGRIAEAVAPYGAVFCKLVLGSVIAINVGASWEKVASYTGNFLVLFSILLGMTLLGFAVAWTVARLLIRDPADATTITFVSGMRNISAGVVLAMSGFDPLVSIPVTGAILFQQPVAALVARLMQRRRAGTVSASEAVSV